MYRCPHTTVVASILKEFGTKKFRFSTKNHRDVFKRNLIMAQMLHLGNSHKKLAQSAFQ